MEGFSLSFQIGFDGSYFIALVLESVKGQCRTLLRIFLCVCASDCECECVCVCVCVCVRERDCVRAWVRAYV